MNPVKVNDKFFVPYLDAEIIQKRIDALAEQMNHDYKGKRPIFLAILNGSFMFAADLFRKINIEAEICFIKLASYKGTKSTGNVITSIGLDESLTGRHVVVIEDIVDTGLTIQALKENLQELNPLSVEVCTLLFKPEAFKGVDIPKYQGFVIPNKFVLGYGLDYDERGRNLKDLYQLKE
jgi:hypoxanthine phosphoribosyltransferase